MRSPIRWFGGKGNLINKLISIIPPHHTYVEVFGGGASLLFAKKPSPVEVYNDINSDLVNFFRVLRSPKAYKRLQRLAALTPYSREEYDLCRSRLNYNLEEVIRAYRFFIVARMSMSGKFGHGVSWSVTETYGGMACSVKQYLSAIDNLERTHKRLMCVQVENQDFRTLIHRYDTFNTFFYLDPPYAHSTRKGGGYSYELQDSDHKDLVTLLLSIKSKAVLSCYWHDVYQPLIDAGWTREDHKTSCYAAGRLKVVGLQGKGSATKMQPRTETVLLSPNCLTGWGLKPISL